MKAMPTLLFSLLVFMNWLPVKDPDWRKLTPLQSTRADVERLLGRSNEAYFADYTLEEGSLSVIYSSGPCRPDRKGGWNVPENVVVGLSFSPKNKKRVSELNLDPKKFRKVVGGGVGGGDVGGVLFYINDETGITYEVQRGRVDEVYYDPPGKYEHLYCGDPLGEKKTPRNKIQP